MGGDKLTHLHAFVDIFVESPLMESVIDEILKMENVEELHEVTGEMDLVALISANDIEEFRDIVKNKILKIHGVKGTVTSIVLQAHKGGKCRD